MNQLRRDGQPQACPAIFPGDGTVCLCEGFEYLFLLLARNSDPCVAWVSRSVRPAWPSTWCGIASRCLAQSPAAQSSAPSPTFEVASVRLAANESNVGPRVRTSPDSLNVHGVSLRDCIQMAYRMRPAYQDSRTPLRQFVGCVLAPRFPAGTPRLHAGKLILQKGAANHGRNTDLPGLRTG
jgi:hypothetical protein